MNDTSVPDIQKYIKKLAQPNGQSFNLSYFTDYLETISVFELETLDKINNINDIIQTAVEFYPPKHIRSNYTPKVCFIVNKYLNVFMKYQGLRFSRSQQVLESIKKFKGIISDLIEQEIQAEIHFWEYISITLSATDKYLHKLEFKLKSMYHYIQNLDHVERIPSYSDLEMYQEMKDLCSKVDPFYGFIPQNKFDLMFECYVESNKDLSEMFNQVIKLSPNSIELENCNCDHSKFDKNEISNNRTISSLILNNFDFFISSVKEKAAFHKINKSITGIVCKNNKNQANIKQHNNNNQNKIDLKLIDYIVHTIYTKIAPSDNTNRQMLAIIRCASFRYLSNKYYIIHGNEWLSKPSQTYIDNVKKIVEETPHDLAISTDIIPPAFSDTSFEKLLLDEDFVEAVDHFNTIQFCTSPIDIWKEVYMAMDSSVRAANKFTNVSRIHSKIAFDDFFTILLPVFSSAQISCPKAMNSYLSCFIGAKKRNSLEIASTSILALLKIMETKI